MILCRRPCRLYDVDVAGVVALALIGVATWWVAARPSWRAWERHTQLAAACVAAEARLDADTRALDSFERELQRLNTVVASQADRAPAADSLSQQLRNMTLSAEQEQLTLLNVAPQPSQHRGPYVITDVTVGARGPSRAFLRFLDHLAQTDPYQSLRAFSIARPAGADPNQCDLNWTIRFYLLAEPELARGGPP